MLLVEEQVPAGRGLLLVEEQVPAGRTLLLVEQQVLAEQLPKGVPAYCSLKK